MITVAETGVFQRKAASLLTPEEKAALIAYLAEHPQTGVLIPGTGGLRKLRWGRGVKGKRGGLRIVYYYHNATMPLYLLTVFGKNERVDLSAEERKRLAAMVEQLIAQWRKHYDQSI
ncbi:hypothetical protein MIT9_P0810 [Methylomarinovum caldicuralii]|uniref:Addiction module toxin RelE n=1 Tax=Methylomarinovum caldicuralii TaxID=438856 RepID=A0AAU9CTJ6_9GAMM|nr:transcriptional regulator [Methylomarinovum caldicuralii]BCX81232.1 hypothetical protein MIT9_P0810 [Methylomarinovum caldicuralii]